MVANALENDNWISDLMHNISASLLGGLILLWIEVDAASYDSTDTEPDEIFWSQTVNRQYSTRSAY
jgi:hypothetical protein